VSHLQVFNKAILPEASHWSFASVGRLSFTFQKARTRPN